MIGSFSKTFLLYSTHTNFPRLFSSKAPTHFEIPVSQLQISYSRSSGPGGQNVNKLNTKAEVRFHLDSASWVPPEAKERLKVLHGNRLTKDGDFVVVSQRTRSQQSNVADCLGKLEELLLHALQAPPPPRITTPPPAVAQQMAAARLQAKKRRSLIKRGRAGDRE